MVSNRRKSTGPGDFLRKLYQEVMSGQLPLAQLTYCDVTQPKPSAGGQTQPWRRPSMFCSSCACWEMQCCSMHTASATSWRNGVPPSSCWSWPEDAPEHFATSSKIILVANRRYVKAAATVLLMLALVTAAANVWVVGSLNRRYIPQACAQAEVLLERKVSVLLRLFSVHTCCFCWLRAQLSSDRGFPWVNRPPNICLPNTESHTCDRQ